MLKLLLLAALLAFWGIPTASPHFGACSGDDGCTACHNCKYCKHCAKGGGSCGVCKKAAG